MAITYKKLWKLMIDKGINKSTLCERAKISPGTMAKMSKDEPVTLVVLDKLCEILNCNIGDIVDRIDQDISTIQTESKELLDMETIKLKLISELNYSEFESEEFIEDAKRMDESLRNYLYLWANENKEFEVSINGVSTKWLQKNKNLNYPAALLALDWIIREPEVAKNALLNEFAR